MEQKNKLPKKIIVFIIVLILAVLGMGGYLVYDKILKNNPNYINEIFKKLIDICKLINFNIICIKTKKMPRSC